MAHCNRTASDRELRRRFRVCVACRKCEAWRRLSDVAAAQCERLIDPLIAIRQICFACGDKCDFGRLGSCKQRPLLEQGQGCAKGKW